MAATKSTGRKTTARKTTSARKGGASRSRASSSSKQPKEVTDGGAIADERAAAGHKNAGVQGGLVDQMTRRSAADVMEGHHCTIDRTHSGVSKEAKELMGEGSDGYGVYVEPAETDEKGFPVQASVLLRNSSHARVIVPYDALRPVDLAERR